MWNFIGHKKAPKKGQNGKNGIAVIIRTAVDLCITTFSCTHFIVKLMLKALGGGGGPPKPFMQSLVTKWKILYYAGNPGASSPTKWKLCAQIQTWSSGGGFCYCDVWQLTTCSTLCFHFFCSARWTRPAMNTSQGEIQPSLTPKCHLL